MVRVKKIDPKKWYSLSDLVEGNLFPWCNGDIRRYRHLVNADKRNKDHLKTMIIGDGKGKRYQMKGQNIINFLAKVENGTIRL